MSAAFRAPDRRPIPRLGDHVRPDDRPAGYDIWRVTSIPNAAGPSDTATIAPLDPQCPIKQVRRWVKSLVIVLPP